MSSTVHLWKSHDREENLRHVTASVLDRMVDKVSAAQRILIKPNLVSNSRALANVPGSSTAVVIEELRKRTAAPIVVGEASFHDTEDAFNTFGYRELPDRYPNVTLEDFNRGESVPGVLYHAGMKEHAIRIARTAKESDLRISLAPMKTHNHFIMSSAIKNWTVGIMVARRMVGTRTWQRWPHFHAQGYRESHASAARILKDFPMDIAIVDGWEAMEGNGPSHGDPVQYHLALAGMDAIAVDATVARLMGFHPDDIGYLVFGQEAGIGTWQEVLVDGNVAIENAKHHVRPHPTFQRQLEWKKPGGRWRSLFGQLPRLP